MPADTTARIPCPFVYASGKPCEGSVVRVEAYRATSSGPRTRRETGGWTGPGLVRTSTFSAPSGVTTQVFAAATTAE